MSGTLTAQELKVGQLYRVEFEDCCVNGYFVSRFVRIVNPGYADHSGDPDKDYDAVEFECGQITGWAVTFTYWGQRLIESEDARRFIEDITTGLLPKEQQ